MGSAVDRYPPWLQKHMATDPDSFEDFHRDIVTNALKNRDICHNCKEMTCDTKCAKCRTVAYCSKTCQVVDWPNHKKICRHVGHVVKVLRSMTEKTRRDFMKLSSCHALCIILRLEGIDADFTYFCDAHYEGETNYRLFTGVVAGGHLYTPELSFFPMEMTQRPPGRKIEPLPPKEELKLKPKICQALSMIKSITFGPPWENQFELFDEYENIFLRKFECGFYIDRQYVDCNDKEAIIKLYGRKKIEMACKETLESWRKRLDARHRSPKSLKDELSKGVDARFAKLIVEVESMTGWTRFFNPKATTGENNTEKDMETNQNVLNLVSSETGMDFDNIC